ncbi:urease accessory protein UreF [Halovulum dunhuangense]|uniref:Urease accessory protein UreF n=1 Tax=Halovulum dunhuangense TaxID=1505036 RepID=A0A849L3D8_9RHOB|nr:urease accessory UreF family protein [Halovulum dunhuangense]NNU80829.1 urease accessory protein UreF [Halovulum dunhuangense]
MTTDGLHQLFAWFSPAYPVGAFAYSHGLEYEIASGTVTDGAQLSAWIAAVLRFGAGRTDAILLAHAWRAPEGDITELADLALALAPSEERALETTGMGRAFALTSDAVQGTGADPLPYPAAVGRAGARAGLALDPLLRLYLHGFAANLVSVAVRFVPLGQTEGQRVLAGLFGTIDAVAAEAGQATLDDIGSCVPGADLAAIGHETLPTRIFRS